jgi:lysophospholipid acyltransferase (LPLAT)-like uncharacterized protein
VRLRFKDISAKIPILDRARIAVLAGICSQNISFYDRSYKITRIASAEAQKYLDEQKPVLFALYHGRMVGLLRVLRLPKNLTILVSRSRDGEIVARMLQHLGFSLARGSPGRKAVEAGKQLVDAARRGQSLAITVDGPRGPQQEVKSGIIRMAEMTGLPIVPFVARARTTYWFWGWDKFMGPKWSTPIVYMYDDPIIVPNNCSDEERERIRLQLDERLTALRNAGEQYWDIVRD